MKFNYNSADTNGLSYSKSYIFGASTIYGFS